jgi:hypothetical protein
MGIKSDKTFEEIVERLVALFKPQTEGAQPGAYSVAASAEVTENLPLGAVLPLDTQDDPQD